ncbi:MAG TPA: 2'-5' RNA ligase family protein [candidate division Zixibacteria bacterium]|nr:2'-5' RNA ligase family protein [candidate division Zixibacteria bacterium]
MDNPHPLDTIRERRHQQYAMIIFLPQPLDAVIAPLRARFDPIYNLVSSHITVVFPFETMMPIEEIASTVGAEIQKQPRIHIELDSIGDFYPKSPIIYWKIKKNNELCELYYRLYARLGVPIPHKIYEPHVTVAREISDHRVMIVKEKIVSYLPNEKFRAGSIDLVTPLVNEKWVSVRTFSLSENGDSSIAT